jgi:hypothetical protein
MLNKLGLNSAKLGLNSAKLRQSWGELHHFYHPHFA